MDGNYEWQKQYTRQRINARLQEAAAHRLAKQGNSALHFPTIPLAQLRRLWQVMMAVAVLRWRQPVFPPSEVKARSAE